MTFASALGVTDGSRSYASEAASHFARTHAAYIVELEIAEVRAAARLRELRRYQKHLQRTFEGVRIHARPQVPSSSDEDHIRALELNTSVLTQKGEEYDERARLLERERPDGRSNELRGINAFEELEALHTEISQNREALRAKMELLATCSELPPDVTLARVKLAERRQQLHALVVQKDALLRGIAQP
ncbi:hypothetical protein HDU83_004705 [Entophlyctis luteolus]|nr:hypothetical protein HDU82_003614 [Entophlyctis luteolus]KAJ3344853.1 hypothetical protein HDU83_004705 [Entophlyctis luteolus]KAJ3382752.1 hypothetical protein HDU84_004073 [Entophlyctis sp. JEL0112]